MTAADISQHAAKAYLNDSAQAIWTDTVLLPCVAQAVLDLQDACTENGIDIQRSVSTTISVESGDTELDEYPTDFIEPIELRERALGSSEDWSEPIDEVTDIDPNNDSSAFINQWSFRKGKIYINPPTSDREIRLLYTALMTPIIATSSTIDITLSKNYLASRTAQVAALNIGNNPTKSELLSPSVFTNKTVLINILLKDQQGQGVRRIGYGRR